jgi:hypothetical protein
MNKDTKKFFVVGIACMFIFMLSLQVVAARNWTVSTDADGNQRGGGVHTRVDTDHWLFDTIQFLDLGQSWADFIVAMAIMIIVFAATFDVLNLTAFSTGWVKYVISAGIAVVFAVTGGIGWFSLWIVKLAGGSVIIATFVTIVIGAGLLIMGTFLKGKAMKMKAKGDADILRSAASKTLAQDQAEIAEANAKIKAEKAATR